MIYHAYLEVDETGACLAHVPDLAGCTAGGVSRETAIAALPHAVRAYLDWCGAHGDPLPDDGVIEIVIGEVVQGCRPWKLGGAHALFSVDRVPLGDAELRTYLRRMGYARADLLDLVRAQPAAFLAMPDMEHGTVRGALLHLASTEAWYLSRLGQRIVEPDPDAGAVEQLVDSRARVVESVLRLSPRQRDLVYVPTDRPSDNPEEGWTLRKVLRRFLEHELTHLSALREAASVFAAAK